MRSLLNNKTEARDEQKVTPPTLWQNIPCKIIDNDGIVVNTCYWQIKKDGCGKICWYVHTQ